MTIFHNKIVQVLVLAVSLGLCLSAIGTIADLWHRKDIVNTTQHDLDVITRENQVLQQQLADAQHSDYVERIARDKLGMVKDGESVILLSGSSTSATLSTGDDGGRPNWVQWWSLFY